LFPLGGWPGAMDYELTPADTPERAAMLAKATPELKSALEHPEKYFEYTIKRDNTGKITGFDVSDRSDVQVPSGEEWDALMNDGPRYYQLRTRWFASFLRYLQHLTLPAIALSLLPMAYITRLTRVSMIDVLASDYVRTARAKGLSRWKVIVRHCLRNAFLPVLSYIGPATAATLVGSFVVEKVFNIPGMGDYFVRSVLNRDQTLILGTVMVYSVLLLSLNLIVDVLYTVVDPRIRIDE
jgi:oligopeptide transport system permease protein